MYSAIPRALFSTFSQIQQSNNTVNPSLITTSIVFSIALLLWSGIGDDRFPDIALVCSQLVCIQIYFWLCVYIYKAQLKFLIWLSAVGVDCDSLSICRCAPLRNCTDWHDWGSALVTAGFLMLPWFVSNLLVSKSTFGFAFTSIKLS